MRQVRIGTVMLWVVIVALVLALVIQERRHRLREAEWRRASRGVRLVNVLRHRSEQQKQNQPFPAAAPHPSTR